MTLNGLFCADVPLRNYSLTHYVSDGSSEYSTKLKNTLTHDR